MCECYGLIVRLSTTSFFFFFNDTATTEIYTLSLHDALPILNTPRKARLESNRPAQTACDGLHDKRRSSSRMLLIPHRRSEEHTSELQSQSNLVCRLLLEKKKKKIQRHRHTFIEIEQSTPLIS